LFKIVYGLLQVRVGREETQGGLRVDRREWGASEACKTGSSMTQGESEMLSEPRADVKSSGRSDWRGQA
jgi:hypothetical protein